MASRGSKRSRTRLGIGGYPYFLQQFGHQTWNDAPGPSSDVSQNVMANLGWDAVRLPHPVFDGDTVYSQSEVLAARPSASRPNVGMVTVRTTGYNQDGVVVITFERTLLVYRRDCGRSIAVPQPPASEAP